jgi:hypothetical protein
MRGPPAKPEGGSSRPVKHRARNSNRWFLANPRRNERPRISQIPVPSFAEQHLPPLQHFPVSLPSHPRIHGLLWVQHGNRTSNPSQPGQRRQIHGTPHAPRQTNLLQECDSSHSWSASSQGRIPAPLQPPHRRPHPPISAAQFRGNIAGRADGRRSMASRPHPGKANRRLRTGDGPRQSGPPLRRRSRPRRHRLSTPGRPVPSLRPPASPRSRLWPPIQQRPCPDFEAARHARASGQGRARKSSNESQFGSPAAGSI